MDRIYGNASKAWQTYRDAWESIYGAEATEAYSNMLSRTKDVGSMLRAKFLELGEGNISTGMQLYMEETPSQMGTYLNAVGLGVGSLRQIIQRGSTEATSEAAKWYGFMYGGIALPNNGGINAIIAEAGDPEMVIPLNAQGADFIVETMNRINFGDSNSNLDQRLEDINRKIDNLSGRVIEKSPGNFSREQYQPVNEMPTKRDKFDFVKMISMGMFEEKT